MATRKPKVQPPVPAPPENLERFRKLLGYKNGALELNRRMVEIPQADMMREMVRTPEGRATLQKFYSGANGDQKRALFELLVKEFQDPKRQANLSIEGREILEAMKGMPMSPERQAVLAADAADATNDGRRKPVPTAEYPTDTGTDPTELSRYPRPELPAGVKPKEKNLKDPNTDNATSSLREEPGLRTQTNVDWVEMEGGSRKPVVSVEGRLGDADLARVKRAEQGIDPGPLSDFKARGSLTSPQQQFDQMFLKAIDGKKASNILQDGIGEVDPLMEMYLMLRANPNAEFKLSPNANFSSPREMAEYLMRNVTPDVLANRFNPTSPSQIGGLKEGLRADRQLAEMTGETFAKTPRDVSEAADQAGVPRGSKANLRYYSEQIIPALEQQLRRRFGDNWGKSYTEIGVPDDIRTAEPAPKGQGLELSEGTTQDLNGIPAAADTAARPESEWQGPLAPTPLTENLAQINAAERGTRMLDRATKDVVDDVDGVPGDWFIESGRGIEGRTVKPGTDLHGMMKEQIAEINTPIESKRAAKEDPSGPAEWSPSEKLPDPNRTQELVEGRAASKRDFEAEKYNGQVDESGKIKTRRTANEIRADIEALHQKYRDLALSDAEKAAAIRATGQKANIGPGKEQGYTYAPSQQELEPLRDELRQALILESLTSRYGKKADAKPSQVGTSEDKPVVNTKGRRGQKAVSEEQVEKELADARIAAGIDPVPAKQAAEAAPAPEAKPVVAEAEKPIDPLDSAATELDPAEAPKQPSEDTPDNRKAQEPPKEVEQEAEANADAQKAESDAESERPNVEAETIPEDVGKPKDKKGGRTWGQFAGAATKYGLGAAAIGLPISALRKKMYEDRELPAAWGNDPERPTMEQMPLDEVAVGAGDPVGVNPFGRHAEFSGLSPAERIRIMQRMGSLKPSLNTQTAQNWSR